MILFLVYVKEDSFVSWIKYSPYPYGAPFISGQGPFPGVIDIAGIGSGSYEYRAALLASKGFVTLALPFFLYDDLPKRLADVELEYFMVSTVL